MSDNWLAKELTCPTSLREIGRYFLLSYFYLLLIHYVYFRKLLFVIVFLLLLLLSLPKVYVLPRPHRYEALQAESQRYTG